MSEGRLWPGDCGGNLVPGLAACFAAGLAPAFAPSGWEIWISLSYCIPLH